MGDETKIQQFALLAKGARGRAISDLITKATSEQGLFVFGELLDVPSVHEIQNGEFAPYFQLLQIFAYGTWSAYRAAASSLPALNDHQKLKLKQLTVISIAFNSKVIPYQRLQSELEIPTVRELEDFIITECFYNSIIQGKLDQTQHCLQIFNAVGRDVRPEQLKQVEESLRGWAGTGENLLATIEQLMMNAAKSAEDAKKRREAVEAKQEDTRKTIKCEMDLRGSEMVLDDNSEYMQEIMEEDRMDRVMDRPERMDRADRMASRPKRRLR